MKLSTQVYRDLLPVMRRLYPSLRFSESDLIASKKNLPADFQINLFLSLGPSSGKPHLAAKKFQEAVTAHSFEWLASIEVAMPGFINIKLQLPWLWQRLASQRDPEPPERKLRIVIDFSSPNMAKQMAVHHIRSTFLGDALSRLYSYLGHHVIKVNHIGDWGTQFGLMLAWFEDHPFNPKTTSLAEIEKAYQLAKEREKDDRDFYRRSRQAVVALQQREPKAVALWSEIVQQSMAVNQAIYRELNVALTPNDVRGESFYQNSLAPLVDNLLRAGIAQKKGQAILVPLPKQNKEGEPMAALLQKSDGGFLYMTTDLAALRYRIGTEKADRILYCVDARQCEHFQTLFYIAEIAGWLTPEVQAECCSFGVMLDAEGHPFKTREGKTFPLQDWISQATEQAEALLAAREGITPSASRHRLAHALAVNAIKYNDLSRNRTTNYRFNLKEALNVTGNNAPYLMYGYVRIGSLLKRLSHLSREAFPSFALSEEKHSLLIDWLMHLNQWQTVIEGVAQKTQPHLLGNYLYQLVELFSQVYERHSFLQESDALVQQNMLLLLQTTHYYLETGMALLGFITVEQM